MAPQLQKPPRLKHFCWESLEGWAREAKRGGSPHCQRKHGGIWCGGTNVSDTPWEHGKDRWEDRNFQQGLTHKYGDTILGLFDHLLLLSVFRCQAFTCHTVSLAPRCVALFWGPGSLKAPPSIHPKLLWAPLVLYNPIHHVHLHLVNHWAKPAPCQVNKRT